MTISELNEAIARKRGWQQHHEGWWFRGDTKHLRRDAPPYASDPVYMRELMVDGWVEIAWHSGKCAAFIWEKEGGVKKDINHYYKCDTPEEAIARAWLAAETAND